MGKHLFTANVAAKFREGKGYIEEQEWLISRLTENEEFIRPNIQRLDLDQANGEIGVTMLFQHYGYKEAQAWLIKQLDGYEIRRLDLVRWTDQETQRPLVVEGDDEEK